jgi:hypothetical protein
MQDVSAQFDLCCDIAADICRLLKDAVCVFVHAMLKSSMIVNNVWD